MADEHRRIEPRMPVAGTGMASDPERIEALQHDYDRRVRASIPRDGPSFGAVLDDAPAFDPTGDEDRVAAREESEPEDADAEEQSQTDDDEPVPALPRTPPDPRMQALHAMLAPPVARPSGRAARPTGPAPIPEPIPASEPAMKAERSTTKTSSNASQTPKPTPKRLGRRGGRAPK